MSRHHKSTALKDTDVQHLENLSRLCRGDIIKMTTIAGSGHPGGSMSSIDIYLTLFTFANISPQTFDDPLRDRVVVSHGHTSPGLYVCLARLGFLDLESVLVNFRHFGPFEGHCERSVPGVEWSTGNLGQGLSAACGYALAARLHNTPYHTFVAMSDAEQAKGQVSEARRFARKYAVSNLTVIIDYNHFQISGRTEEIMPVNIKENYRADGWEVLEVSGHDFRALHRALHTALADTEKPYAIIAQTVIGHGVSFMENKADYHGRALTRDECMTALKELGVDDDVDRLLKKRGKKIPVYKRKPMPIPRLTIGNPTIYHDATHPRAVFGAVLEEVARVHTHGQIAVFDCDLTESVQTEKFAHIVPHQFFEAGVSEHTTATISGALSLNGVVTVWADFGVFALDEVYNQLRLNAINETNLKIVATHLGYNVGPDGKTHHCIDYIGLLRNLFGFRLIVPSDPNQTDHATRYMLNQPGNWVMGLTRTKLPVVTRENGALFYDKDYAYTYGTVDVIRDGDAAAILTFGPLLQNAVEVWHRLRQDGISVRICNVSSPLHPDTNAVLDAAATGLIITYEDHNVLTGLGSVIADIIAAHDVRTRFIKVGIDKFGGSDTHEVLYREAGLDTETVYRLIKSSVA